MCTVIAFPSPTSYSWEKDGTPVDSAAVTNTVVDATTTQTSLSIASAQFSDAGAYRCTATNSQGSDSGDITLTVLGKYRTTCPVTV